MILKMESPSTVSAKTWSKLGSQNWAGTLAMKSLIDKGMLERFMNDSDGYDYTAVRITSKGMDWLSKNKENLALKIRKDELQKISAEDIPF